MNVCPIFYILINYMHMELFLLINLCDEINDWIFWWNKFIKVNSFLLVFIVEI
jgi:hypothetical protein